jgi:hypothetical protein
MTPRPSAGASVEFLDRLRAFESGIDPELHSWYVANFKETVLEYPLTSAPGRLVRDLETGEHVIGPVSIEGYFRTLGVLDAFDPSDAASLTRMQYRSFNPWGFVGYQIGEEVLFETGYYEPPLVAFDDEGTGKVCPRIHRGGLHPVLWSGGVTERFVARLDGGPIVATDVNSWDGRFTGKNGVHSLADLMSQDLQEIVIRDIICHNLRTVSEGLSMAGLSLSDCLGLQWPRDSAVPEAGVINGSLSGIIASCHLCGSGATLSLLIESRLAKDDLGTTALDYMERFGNFDVADLLQCAPDVAADLAGRQDQPRREPVAGQSTPVAAAGGKL